MAEANNTPPAQNPEVRLFAVESDVRSLKHGFDTLSTNVTAGFKDIGAKLEAKGSTNWTVVGLMVGAVFTLSGWGFALFGSYQSRNEAAIKEQKEQSAKFMDRSDIVGLFAATEKTADIQRMYQQRITELQEKLVSKNIEQLSRDIDGVKEVQKQMVPLSTHQELWKNQADVNKTLLDNTKENAHNLGEITKPSDTIERLQRRVDEIETRAATRRSE